MNYPKITVVTPSYNQGEFIERTIVSIINQNYPNLEYFVIDGGSTDNTVEIIKKYQDKIDYWVSEKDRGQTDAINKGMRRATGDIVCWINSDDILLPGTLFTVGRYFMKHPNIEYLNGVVIEIGRQDEILKMTHTILCKWFAERGSFNVLQQGMFWKRSLFEKVGYLDVSFHAMMDYEFIIRLFESDIKMAFIDKPLGAIRIYGETKTAMGGDIWARDKNELKRRYNGRYISNKRDIYFLLYTICKLLRGNYLQDFLFKMRYKNEKYYKTRKNEE